MTPACAALTYLYAILEAESRIAVLAAGLDPVLGLLHADIQCRDSLVFDVMEPVRPAVDAFLLDFLTSHRFTARELVERLDGQCRLLPPLTEELASTAPLWARRVRPIAQHLANHLLAAEREQTTRARASRAHSSGSGKSALRPRGRGIVIRDYRPRLEPDRDPRRAPAAGTKRRLAMTQVVTANRAWKGEVIDPEDFRAILLPKIQQLTLEALVKATGLTKSACSRVRAGLVIPHARHRWAFARLVSFAPREVV